MLSIDNATVLAALIAAFASLCIAAFNFFSTRSNQVSIRKNQIELEALQAKLRQEQAENDARRDYVYEARKRLYQQYEPLLFQLVEFSDSAIWRIQALAREAKNGNLEPNQGGWLSAENSKGYYMISTIYRLLSPLAYIKLIQRNLTLVDLTVDPNLNNQYLLAKWLYATFTDGFRFASMEPRLEYDPDSEGWHEKRKDHPEKFWRQGVHLGMLDNAVESLLMQDTNGVSRCMSYGEFDTQYKNPEFAQKFSGFVDQFLDFHPKKRPILWRILITRVHFYEAFLRTREIKLSDSQESNTPKLLKPIAEENLQRYDWRQSPEEATNEEVFRVPFKVAQAYLREVLGSMCDL